MRCTFMSGGDISPPDFAAAGDHFNPYRREHGLANPQGPHAGDLPNFTVNPDGTAEMDAMAAQVTLWKGFENSLLRPQGTSLIVHARADDYRSDPSGLSGSRIAGGVIREVE